MVHIILCQNPYELMWTYNKFGGRSWMELGYYDLSTISDVIVSWWWKYLWKVKDPSKTKFLM